MTTPQVFNTDEMTEALLGAVTLDTQAGFIPPWRHFKGTLTGFKTRYHQTKSNSTMVVVQALFGNPEFQMISAIQPINQPNCELEFWVFDLAQIRDNTDLGVFLTSAKLCQGGDVGLKLMQLKGQVLEVQYTGGHTINKPFGPQDSREYRDTPSDSFEVLAIGDKRNPSPHQPAGIEGAPVQAQAQAVPDNGVANDILDVLNGKTLRLFESEAMSLPWVQQDATLFSHFANGTVGALINAWLADEKIIRQGEGTEAVFYKKVTSG